MPRPDQPEIQVVESQKALAAALGKTAGTISQWIKRGMPVRGDGKFEVEIVQAWADANIKRGRPFEHDDRRKLARESLEAQTRYRQEKALLAKLDRQAREGELVERELVENILVQRASLFRKSALGLGRRLALELAGMDAARIQERIDQEVRGLLEEVSKTGRLPDPPTPTEDSDDER